MYLRHRHVVVFVLNVCTRNGKTTFNLAASKVFVNGFTYKKYVYIYVGIVILILIVFGLSFKSFYIEFAHQSCL